MWFNKKFDAFFIIAYSLFYLFINIELIDAKCGIPGVPALNGTFSPMKTTYNEGEVVEYQCAPPRLLVGPHTRRCQQNGSWSHFVPLCMSELLKTAYVVRNPNTDKFPTQIGRSLYSKRLIHFYFRLNKVGGPPAVALQLVLPDQQNQCSKRGNNWSDDNFLSEPRLLLNRQKSSTFSLAITSDAISWNYGLDNSARIIASDGVDMICDIKVFAFNVNSSGCGTPDQSVFAEATERNDSNGTIFDFSCKSGYRLQGSPSITCNEYGFWKDPSPICKAITCPHIERDEDDFYIEYEGQLFEEEPVVNSTARYTCFSDDYILVGHDVRTCLENGTWSYTRPRCEHRWSIKNATEDVMSTQPESLLSSTSVSNAFKEVEKEFTEVFENFKKIVITIISALFILIIATLIMTIVILRYVCKKPCDDTTSSETAKRCDMTDVESPDELYHSTDETSSIIYRNKPQNLQVHDGKKHATFHLSGEIYDEIYEGENLKTSDDGYAMSIIDANHSSPPDLLKRSDNRGGAQKESNDRWRKNGDHLEMGTNLSTPILTKASSQTPILNAEEKPENHSKVMFEDNELYEESLPL